MTNLEKAACITGRERVTDLEKVEDIRLEMRRTIAIITGVPIENIVVGIQLHSQDKASHLLSEAHELEWFDVSHLNYPIKHMESFGEGGIIKIYEKSHLDTRRL